MTGVVVAAAIAATAYRARALSISGAIAAALVGTAAIAAGWAWGALLIAFFVSASSLGRWNAEARARRIGRIVAKGDRRDAWQVLANGGLFAVAGVAYTLHGAPAWLAVGGGAIATATADTWATELGSVSGAMPRSILGWRSVPPGTSGGVTLTGTLASVGGATLIGGLAAALGWTTSVAFAILVAGIAGSFADSVIGAAIQCRRWCDQCHSATEQMNHVCGTPTRIVGGVTWIDNDVVNLLSGLLGAATALFMFLLKDLWTS